MRWIAILAFSLSALVITPACRASTACAIRWDANYSNGPTDPGTITAKTLAPPQFRNRVPLHGKFLEDSRLIWEPTRRSMDVEIELASRAGICWAFLLGGQKGKIDLSNPINRGFVLMKSSKFRLQVPITAMIGSDNLGSTSDFEAAIEMVLEIMKEPNYLKIRGRPILWIPIDTRDIRSYWSGDISIFGHALAYLRNRAQEIGLGLPYIVLLAATQQIATSVKADAISRYAIVLPYKNRESYKDFRRSVERFWDQQLDAVKVDYVPTVMIGWDPRPRHVTPTPWLPPDNKDSEHYVVPPTNDEIFVACKSAAQWNQRNADRNPNNLLLIYSWNENDEAGTVLGPTLGDEQGNHLHACASALK